MKRKILLLILSILIISSCVTAKNEKRYILPPKPVREELNIKKPYTIQDLAYMVNYYDSLVSEWEEWGKTVEEITDR